MEMNNSKKAQALKSLLRNDVIQMEDCYTVLDQTEILKNNYVDYMITEPVNVDEELKRLPNTDFDLCAALMTMLMREDYFSNGSFRRRVAKGQVTQVIEKLISMLDN